MWTDQLKQKQSTEHEMDTEDAYARLARGQYQHCQV